ncbi:MAG: glycosyltransferase family 2 protein [Candidatus Gracilibacteria bacterium]
MPPFFSVIMPALDRAYCIKDSLRSVLNQKFSDFEIIVFDAGSRDGTAEVARSLNDPRIKVGTYPESKGVNFSRNRAIEMATGKWMVLLDSDDQLTPGAFDVMKKDIDSLKGQYPLIRYGTCEIKTGIQKSFFYKKQGGISYEGWMKGEKMWGEFLTVVHRKIFEKEMFHEDMRAFEGYFWLKVAQEHKVWIHNINLRLYDSRGENRLTKRFLRGEFIEERKYSYQKFLNTFGKDMERLNLQFYIHNLSVLSYLHFLTGDKKRGREILKGIIKHNPNIKAYGMYLCSFLGKWPFYLVGQVARRLY